MGTLKLGDGQRGGRNLKNRPEKIERKEEWHSSIQE
jgi:hypothetical protein